MELEFIQWLRQRLGSHSRVPIGVGDDAAVVSWAKEAPGDCVLATDMLLDGVHFHLDQVDPQRIGRKVLAANLSDLAAMASRPVAALLSIALPHANAMTADALARQLVEGMLPLAKQFDVAIVGGDTNSWTGPLAVNIAVVGETTAHGPLRRQGAKPGDALVVTGEFGGSLLGKQFHFQPRVHEALYLAEHTTLHAGTDCSDGLARDASHLAEESGCGLVLHVDKIPIAPAACELAAQAEAKKTPLEHALGDGEDFELLLAMPATAAANLVQSQPLDVPLTCVGEFVPEPGLWASTADGQRTPLAPVGYEHGGAS